MSKKGSLLACLVILAVVGVVLGLYAVLNQYGNAPLSDTQKHITIAVRPGQSFSDTVKELTGSGLLHDSRKFTLIARIKGLDTKIQAGEYRFSSLMTPNEVLNTLTRGETLLHSVTIPEGYNLFQIAEILEKKGILSSKQFLEAASDPERVRSAGISADLFEGYLFPDTYRFPKGIEADRVLEIMRDRLHQVFMPIWRKKGDLTTLSFHEVVTLASIIEKETGEPSERALIAAVFLNRLKRGMRLESDPTVIYGIMDFDGNLTRKDLATYTPYNTYRIKGLPPGPISSPGIDSLKSVLMPADESYLYFVSRNDGTHQFSRTIEEHNKAVRTYQKKG